jgi:hypothetical protein
LAAFEFIKELAKMLNKNVFNRLHNIYIYIYINSKTNHSKNSTKYKSTHDNAFPTRKPLLFFASFSSKYFRLVGTVTLNNFSCKVGFRSASA